MQKNISQPYLAIVTATMVVLLSFGIISVFSEHMFHTWVSYLALTVIPVQIYVSVYLKCEHPKSIAVLPQPWRGLAFLGLIMFVGAFVTPFGLYFVNGGLFTEPTPFLITWAVFAVVILLWLAKIFHGWPFTSLTKKPMLAGAGVLIATYVITTVLFNHFFNFENVKDAPFYDAALDPGGLYPNWIALSFATTSAAAILVSVLLFQSWPVQALSSRWPLFAKHPWDMLVMTVFTAAITCAVFFIGINVLELAAIDFMVRFPVSFIFGTFICLNMSEYKLFEKISQPLRGIMLFVISAFVGVIMYHIYYYFAPMVMGKELAGGAPTYQLELWIAPALLSITFPVIVVITAFFDFWPLRRKK